MTLRHKTRFNTSGQGFKKDPIRYQCYYDFVMTFFVEKMKEAFAMQQLLTFFQPKILAYLRN